MHKVGILMEHPIHIFLSKQKIFVIGFVDTRLFPFILSIWGAAHGDFIIVLIELFFSIIKKNLLLNISFFSL